MSSTHCSCTHRPHPHFNQSWSCSPKTPWQKSHMHSLDEDFRIGGGLLEVVADVEGASADVDGTGSLLFLAGRPRPFLASGFFAAAASSFSCFFASRSSLLRFKSSSRSFFLFSLSLFRCSFSSNSCSFFRFLSSSIFKQSALVSTRAFPVF